MQSERPSYRVVIRWEEDLITGGPNNDKLFGPDRVYSRFRISFDLIICFYESINDLK